MCLYEENFERLLKLFPDLQHMESMSCRYLEGRLPLYLQVIETAPYTTTVALSTTLEERGVFVRDPVMRIRVYHDAKVAEVVAYQRQSRFQGRYEYPNPDMRQRFEKRRVNQFLQEWLDHCLAHRSPYLRSQSIAI